MRSCLRPAEVDDLVNVMAPLVAATREPVEPGFLKR